MIAQRLGWRYEWVADLDRDVYAVLIELLRQGDAAAAEDPDAD